MFFNEFLSEIKKKTFKKHGYANEKGQTLPSQGEMDENTLFTRKCTSEPSEILVRVTTLFSSSHQVSNFDSLEHLAAMTGCVIAND